jgi:MFS transporter, NNP family, nitrate/nitrite transporter
MYPVSQFVSAPVTESHHFPWPSLVGSFTAIMVLCAIFNEAGNGANFALVPHCNPNNNGVMSGLVGGFGNIGGIFFALIFRFQPAPIGRPFWISGILAMVQLLYLCVYQKFSNSLW